MQLVPRGSRAGVTELVLEGRSVADWLDGLGDPAAATAFAASLCCHCAAAVAWELPPLTSNTLETPFACVVVEHPSLARTRADPRSFADHLRGRVATFENLGGDAILVAPVRRGPIDAYAHLAAFLRSATPAEHADLFGAVGEAVRGALGPDPLWVSTAGLGVPWLHVRLDRRPKYYRYAPYRHFERGQD